MSQKFEVVALSFIAILVGAFALAFWEALLEAGKALIFMSGFQQLVIVVTTAIQMGRVAGLYEEYDNSYFVNRDELADFLRPALKVGLVSSACVAASYGVMWHDFELAKFNAMLLIVTGAANFSAVLCLILMSGHMAWRHHETKAEVPEWLHATRD